MITADDLCAIAERYVNDEGHGGQGEYPREKHADRGALLDLLRCMADVTDWHVEGRDSDLCIFCQRLTPNHMPDCPAPLLEALRDTPRVA